MPYIGKSPSFGVRNRFVYVASSGATSVSGADANGATLTFTDGAFVDVYLNGVLLKPTTDYNTSTANTIAGLSALNTNDEVTVVVYDIFAVADTVSATSGGTFSGAVTLGGGVAGDLDLNTDSAVIKFGADDDVTLTHVADTGLRLANPTGADLDLTTNEQAGSSGSPLNMDLNFRGYQNNVMAIVRSHDESSSTGHGELQFHITKNSVGTRETLNIDHEGNVKFPLLQNLELTALNKAPHIKTTDQLTQLADDAFITVSNSGEPLQGLLIVTNYNLGHTGIFRHDYASSTTTLISGNSGGFANSDSDGYICVYTANNSYDVYIKNRQGAARDIKALFLGTYQ